MKQLLYLFLLSTGLISQLNAQINTDCTAPYDNATALVNVLVNGVPFSNATLSGFECSAGYFQSTSPDNEIGIPSGLVMATDGLDGGFGGGAGADTDLSSQLTMVGSSSTNLNNLIILEFDFEPNSDQIAFEYVFASNEYPGYTCSQYNDIFGFFLSGPGISGPFENNAVNIALVPDPNSPGNYTNTPVTINTINSGTPSAGNPAPCSDIDPNWEDYSVFFSENAGVSTVNYPGFTVPLIATYDVIPCETYHIKLAIADVSDGALNSAVYLAENSFSSIGNYVETGSDYSPWIGNDTTLVEGCFDGEITFGLTEAIETDYVIGYEVSGTATDGIDFEQIGTQIIIPSGDTEVSIPVVPLYDGIAEGNETLSILATVSDGCEESIQEYNFIIVDRQELYLTMPSDTAFCPGDDVIFIDPDLSGGIQPLTYSWTYEGNLYSNQQQIGINTENIGLYEFHVEDLCDSEADGSIMTTILEAEEPLQIYATYTDIEVCMDDVLETIVDLNGGIGNLHYQWYLNGNVYSDSLNFDIPTSFPYTYEFELEISDECSNTVSESFTVDVMDCYVPNVFSPNGDGQNDYWYVDFGDVVSNVRVHIYNRWGQEVYRNINYEKCNEKNGDYCWDGTDFSSGDDCLEGTYYYTFELLDGRKHTGIFNLFR